MTQSNNPINMQSTSRFLFPNAKRWLAGIGMACMLAAHGSTVAAPSDEGPSASKDIEQQFKVPPASVRPQVWWHWMNANVSREGITADLESMKRAGLSQATIFTFGGLPQGTMVSAPQFYDMVEFAAKECERLGLKLGMHNSPGCVGSGGPWITPELSMKEVTSSEIQVRGPVKFHQKLSIPIHKHDFYRDVAVLAFPTPEDEVDHAAGENPVTITTNAPDIDVSELAGEPIQGGHLIIKGAPEEEFYYLQAEFAEPINLRTMLVKVPHDMGTGGFVHLSEDGVNFRRADRYEFKPRDAHGYAHVHLAGGESIKVKAVRLPFEWSVEHTKFPPIDHIKFTNRSMNPHIIDKALFEQPHNQNDFPHSRYMLAGMQRTMEEDTVIDPKSIVNLTSLMQPDGTLEWDVPPGDWTIMRFGFTTTGAKNGWFYWMGLECDKLAPEGIEASWNGMMKPAIERLGNLAGTVLVESLIDSFEVGGQNWTDKMPEKFQAQSGYDLIPYLPTFTGRTVGSPAITERFLWDLRRTIANLFATNYHAEFTRLCNESGLRSIAEPYWAPYEAMLSGSKIDIPMAEFWQGNFFDTSKPVSSIAHGYGKRIVAAESFTSRPPEYAGWRDDPYSLKALGDRMYTQGVNRFVFHSFIHQPWLNVKPGLTMGQHGIDLNRNNTWFELSGGWLQYLARCQYLLQEGRTIADVAYFTGQGAPVVDRPGNPPLPAGYYYDSINADLLMNHASVKDGRLVLKSGATYAVLVLTPDDPLMTPELLGKIKELVEDGLTVVGPPPTSSPSLKNYPACDQEINRLVKELWGETEGVGNRQYGWQGSRDPREIARYRFSKT
jgi:hypothetical protein